jgi:AmiR/NasT family two-component response regulator
MEERPVVQRASRLPKEIMGLDIAVVTLRDESGALLIRELQRTHARVRHVWPVPELLPQDIDVLLCDLLPDLSRRIPWVPGDPKAALVLLVDGLELDLHLVRNLAPDAILHRPFTAFEILPNLLLAQSHFNYARRLTSRIHKLEETMQAVRTVERAKMILMIKREMGEEEAYRHMRQEAMSRRVTINAVAAAIVDSYELMG